MPRRAVAKSLARSIGQPVVVDNRVGASGAVAAQTVVTASRVQVQFTTVGMTLPYTKDARLRILGVLLAERSTALPEIPTMAEAGLSNVTIPTWQAIFLPPPTAQDLARAIAQKINETLLDTEVREQFDRLFLKIEGSTPEKLAEQIARDIDTWCTFIRDNAIPKQWRNDDGFTLLPRQRYRNDQLTFST